MDPKPIMRNKMTPTRFRRGLCAYVAMTMLGLPMAVAGQQAPAAPAPQAGVPVARPTLSRDPSRLFVGARSTTVITIQGNTLNSTSGTYPNALVRLRDARTGQIIDSTVADNAGLFTLHAPDPGSYIVEIMGNDQVVQAASQLLNVSAGETVSTVVKLPWRAPPAGGLLGSSIPSAVAIAAAAVSSGVLAKAVTGQSVSPQ